MTKKLYKEQKDYAKLEKRNNLVQLENFYVNAQFNNLPEVVEHKKEEIVDKLTEFQENYVTINEDRQGNKYKIVNPYLVSTYFFKSINPLSNIEPVYNSEKLAIVWDLYMYLVEQVNMNIDTFNPTLSHFAKFAGISLTTLRNYRNSGDKQMCILLDKIYDETMDSNFTLAQNARLKEKTTALRLKIENEIVEQPVQKQVVNINANLDLDKINSRITELANFNKKVKYIEDSTNKE